MTEPIESPKSVTFSKRTQRPRSRRYWKLCEKYVRMLKKPGDSADVEMRTERGAKSFRNAFRAYARENNLHIVTRQFPDHPTTVSLVLLKGRNGSPS